MQHLMQQLPRTMQHLTSNNATPYLEQCNTYLEQCNTYLQLAVFIVFAQIQHLPRTMQHLTSNSATPASNNASNNATPASNNASNNATPATNKDRTLQRLAQARIERSARITLKHHYALALAQTLAVTEFKSVIFLISLTLV